MTMKIIDTLTLAAEEYYIYAAVIDQPNGFAYFGDDEAPAHIVKVRLSDLTRVGAITLDAIGDGTEAVPHPEGRLHTAVIDQPNGFAYFCGRRIPGQIIKIRLSDFTRVGAIYLEAGQNQINGSVIDLPNGFAYFACCNAFDEPYPGETTTPGQIIKVDLDTFTVVDVLTLESNEGRLYNGVIDQPNGFAYFCISSIPGRIVKIDLNTFTRVGSFTLGTGEEYTNAIAIDAPNGFLYVGTWTDQGIIVKIRLSDFTRVGSITLPVGEGFLDHTTIDLPNGLLYFGTNWTYGLVIKINLHRFTRMEALPLVIANSYNGEMVIDQPNGFLYFGVLTEPGIIFKIGGLHNMNPASKDVKDLLEAEGSLGLTFKTNLFVGNEPTEPDDCVTIFDTPGSPPQLTLAKGEDYFYPSIQIRVRDRDYLYGWDLMNDIKTLLHGWGQDTINGTYYAVIRCTQEPSLLDWDENGRARFVTTFDIQRR